MGSRSSPEHKLTQVYSKHTIYAIGDNRAGQLGVQKNQIRKVNKLTGCNISHIECIYCAMSTTILVDVNNEFFSIGGNIDGECGIGSEKNVINKWSNVPFMKTLKSQDETVKVKICINPWSRTVFLITSKNKIYGYGCNEYGQLGIGQDSRVLTPQLIDHIDNIVDLQCATSYSIALSDSSVHSLIIISFWIRVFKINTLFPDCLAKTIKAYCQITNIYATGVTDIYMDGSEIYNVDTGTENMNERPHVSLWTRVDFFKHIHVGIIRCGRGYSLFVDNNNYIWCYGNNAFGQLGLGITNGFPVQCTKNTYFTQNNITITDIQCGESHNLVLGDDNRIYSWGGNQYGQCGHDTVHNNYYSPKKIATLTKYKIIAIKCGAKHSYARTENNQHFLWGDNSSNECIIQTDENYITVPQCINEHAIDDGTIKDIFLGNGNTILMIE